MPPLLTTGQVRCPRWTLGAWVFDLAAEFGVLAAVEYQSGQAERLVTGKLARQCDDDVRRGLDADDGGRAGPANDLRDQILL